MVSEDFAMDQVLGHRRRAVVLAQLGYAWRSFRVSVDSLRRGPVDVSVPVGCIAVAGVVSDATTKEL